MPKGKAEKIDLSDLSFEEAVRRAWEAEPPTKDGKGKPSSKNGKPAVEQAENEQKRKIREGEESPG